MPRQKKFTTMKELMFFIGGAAVGAAVALLMAPEKGEVLRSRIRKVVTDDIELGREIVGVVQDAVAETSKEVKQTIAKTR